MLMHLFIYFHHISFTQYATVHDRAGWREKERLLLKGTRNTNTHTRTRTHAASTVETLWGQCVAARPAVRHGQLCLFRGDLGVPRPLQTPPVREPPRFISTDKVPCVSKSAVTTSGGLGRIYGGDERALFHTRDIKHVIKHQRGDSAVLRHLLRVVPARDTGHLKK